MLVNNFWKKPRSFSKFNVTGLIPEIKGMRAVFRKRGKEV